MITAIEESYRPAHRYMDTPSSARGGRSRSLDETTQTSPSRRGPLSSPCSFSSRPATAHPGSFSSKKKPKPKKIGRIKSFFAKDEIARAEQAVKEMEKTRDDYLRLIRLASDIQA